MCWTVVAEASTYVTSASSSPRSESRTRSRGSASLTAAAVTRAVSPSTRRSRSGDQISASIRAAGTGSSQTGCQIPVVRSYHTL